MTREELFFTHVEDIGEQDVPVTEEFKTGGTVRKSPIESATSVQEGVVAYGSDNAFYITKQDKNGVQRWQKIAGTEGFLDTLKVLKFDQTITGKKGNYDGFAFQTYFLPNTSAIPLNYVVYRNDLYNTKYEVYASFKNILVANPFWEDPNIAENEMLSYLGANTTFSPSVAKILSKNIVADLNKLEDLYRKIDNEIQRNIFPKQNLALIIDRDYFPLGAKSIAASQTPQSTSQTTSGGYDPKTVAKLLELKGKYKDGMVLNNSNVIDKPLADFTLQNYRLEMEVDPTYNDVIQAYIKNGTQSYTVWRLDTGVEAEIVSMPTQTYEEELEDLLRSKAIPDGFGFNKVQKYLGKTDKDLSAKEEIIFAYGTLAQIKKTDPEYNRFSELWKLTVGEAVPNNDYYLEYQIKPQFIQIFENYGFTMPFRIYSSFSNQIWDEQLNQIFKEVYELKFEDTPAFETALFDKLKELQDLKNSIGIDITKDYKFIAGNATEAKYFFGWALKKGAVWIEDELPDEDVYQAGYYYINEKDIQTGLSLTDFEEDKGQLLTLEQIQADMDLLYKESTPETTPETTEDAKSKKSPKPKKANDTVSVKDDFTELSEKSLEEVEKEYDDIMFLISVTPPIDVINVSKLKQRAKELKDTINGLLMVEKDIMLKENNIFDELFTASSIQPKHRYNLKPYIDGFAPNGTPTQLPPKVYDLVLTDDFENWFGDFQMAYQFKNSKYREVPCSIVKNVHYEPQIVFHGTGAVFSFFDFNKFPAMYFAENYYYAEWFAQQKGAMEGHDGYVYPFLLNIRNPLDLTLFGIEPVAPQEFMDYIYLQCGLKEDELKLNPALIVDKTKKYEAWVYLRNSPEMLKVFRDTKLFDGIVYYEQNPPIDPAANNYKTKGFIIFEANNAKLVDPERHDFLLGSMRSFYLKKGGKL